MPFPLGRRMWSPSHDPLSLGRITVHNRFYVPYKLAMLLRRDPTAPSDWDTYAQLLRTKWHEVPSSERRHSSVEWLALSDSALKAAWTTRRTAEDFSSREWYRTLYSPIFREKTILDLGCGLGFDTLTFAERGARVVCADIVESNVQLVQRVAGLLGVENIDFRYVDTLASLDRIPAAVDAIWCAGSFHHAPKAVLRQEVQVLLPHLPVGGRWIQLAYPRLRWERDGKLPFSTWGDRTDGSAPWAEWYDLTKLRALLAPASFDTILNFEFHDNDFVWFDLVRRR